MNEQKEMTVLNISVGADAERSSNISTNNSITDDGEDFNSARKNFIEMNRELRYISDPYYIRTVSMSELYDTVYQSKPPLIDSLLYPGVYLFAGAPKIGKSFLMAQLAYHISTGAQLWDYPVHKSTVLYLALEDDYRRLQGRLYRMFGAESVENLFFSVSVNSLSGGLNQQLKGFITRNPDTRLIIIDTLQKIREAEGEKYSYANDYQIISSLKEFADNNGVCLLLVHHTRKQQAEDKFDMISGTNGLLGAADGAFLLQKEKRTSNTATLEISGRDQQDQKLYLVRNQEKLIWEFERSETELWKEPPDLMLEKISQLLDNEQSEWSGSASELAVLVSEDLQPNILTRKLNVKAGRLMNEYGIEYTARHTRNGSYICLKRKM